MKFENVLFLTKITLFSIALTLLLHVITSITRNDTLYMYALSNISLADFNFAAVGDWGCNSNTKNTVSNIIDKNPKLVLGLGDYAYRDKANCWFQIVDPIDHKMKIVIGNHDHLGYKNKASYSSPLRLQQYLSHFNLSKQFYSFNYGNVHFLAISTEVPFEPGSEQYDFVKGDLEKTVSEPNTKWTVVFYHRLAYTSPVFPGSGPTTVFRAIYHPLFEKYGVDLVIQAHNHNYQRSYPIKYNAGNSSNPLITDNDTTNYYDPKGQIFTIVGTGGVSVIHNFKGSAAKYTAVQFQAFGFLNINVLHNGTMLDGKFYDNNGTIKDHFTITKSSKKENNSNSQYHPKLKNDYYGKFKIESVYKGLRLPTDMAFLGQRDILVLEKNNGMVERITNGNKWAEPMLDVDVSYAHERGMLGIAVSKVSNGTTYVFLYYTESKHDGNDICPKSNYCIRGTEPIGNRLYRYQLTADSTKLINPKLLLDLPAIPGPEHNGGKMIVDTNKNILLLIGDVLEEESRTQNYEHGQEPDGTGGILKVDQYGHPIDGAPLGSKYPLDLYYAYGIRNGFGLDFDPVTGTLWDTENGPEFGDEINQVRPGFNSGWKDIQGKWNHKDGKAQKGPLNLDGLEDFNGKGKYSEPEFIWQDAVGPTAIKFFNSDKFGREYKDSIFVGDVNNGNIYHFSLNKDRTSLLLNGTLADKVANSPEELEKITFAEEFGGITDLEVGPDGYLYVLSFGQGAIYKIVPK